MNKFFPQPLPPPASEDFRARAQVFSSDKTTVPVHINSARLKSNSAWSLFANPVKTTRFLEPVVKRPPYRRPNPILSPLRLNSTLNGSSFGAGGTGAGTTPEPGLPTITPELLKEIDKRSPLRSGATEIRKILSQAGGPFAKKPDGIKRVEGEVGLCQAGIKGGEGEVGLMEGQRVEGEVASSVAGRIEGKEKFFLAVASSVLIGIGIVVCTIHVRCTTLL